MAATFVPGGQVVRTKYNFVSAFDLHKPDVDPELALRYGSQSLVGLLEMIGSEKPTEALEYIHHEEDWIMPKILATNGGAGGAGAAVTFTVDVLARTTVTFDNPPYNSGVTETILPVRVGDTLLIKPGAGTISASTYIRAFVQSVDPGANTFVAAPLDSSDSIPNIPSASEIVIYGNMFGEASGQPKSRNSKTLKFTNNLQIIKDTHVVTGSEEKIILWVNVQGTDGKFAPYWYVKGEDDTYKRFMNHTELTILLSEKLNNSVIEDPQATADTPIRSTEGLIPFILGGGVISNYSSITGWTLADAETLASQLDKQKGSKMNLLYAGFNLSKQIDRELGDRFVNGGISYGMYNFDEEKKVALEFQTFSIAGYTYQKHTYEVFNDLQTLGADGYTFPDEGMVIPMDNRVISMYQDRVTVPSLRLRYLEGRKVKTAYVDRFEVDGEDRIELNYLSECGFEGFAPNRFAYIKRT